MKLRKLLFVCVFSLLGTLCIAQETDLTESNANVETTVESETEPAKKGIYGKIYAPAASFTDFTHSTDFVASMGPGLYLNTESTTCSAPSPIVYPIMFGLIWPNYTFLSFEPTMSFFSMYHLFYNGMVLPAEIENRTTLTLSFMLNLPIVFSLYYGDNRLQLNTGLSFLMRFGLKANGVNNADTGYTGNVASDIVEMNKWFWTRARFIYLSAGASWLFGLTGNLKAGPSVNLYIPLGTIFSGEHAQGMIATVGMKISL